jgi:hypothetical protein
MNWQHFFNDTLFILTGMALCSWIIGCITAVIISLHIESYCKKIGVYITDSNLKSFLGLKECNENREILDNHTQKLSYIYSIITFFVLFVIFF